MRDETTLANVASVVGNPEDGTVVGWLVELQEDLGLPVARYEVRVAVRGLQLLGKCFHALVVLDEGGRMELSDCAYALLLEDVAGVVQVGTLALGRTAPVTEVPGAGLVVVSTGVLLGAVGEVGSSVSSRCCKGRALKDSQPVEGCHPRGLGELAVALVVRRASGGGELQLPYCTGDDGVLVKLQLTSGVVDGEAVASC